MPHTTVFFGFGFGSRFGGGGASRIFSFDRVNFARDRDDDDDAAAGRGTDDDDEDDDGGAAPGPRLLINDNDDDNGDGRDDEDDAAMIGTTFHDVQFLSPAFLNFNCFSTYDTKISARSFSLLMITKSNTKIY